MNAVFSRLEMRTEMAAGEMEVISRVMKPWLVTSNETVSDLHNESTSEEFQGQDLIADARMMHDALTRLLDVQHDLFRAGMRALLCELSFDVDRVGGSILRDLELIQEWAGTAAPMCKALQRSIGKMYPDLPEFALDSLREVIEMFESDHRRSQALSTQLSNSWPLSRFDSELIRKSREQAKAGDLVSVEAMIAENQ